jgi:predicted nucleic acid-binding protein
MAELRLEVTEIVVYLTTVEVDDGTAKMALAAAHSGELSLEVSDAIDAALAAHVERSEDWIGATVEDRMWELADGDDQPGVE